MSQLPETGYLKIKYRRIRQRGESPSTYYYKVAQGLMPPPVHLGPRASALPEHEDEILNAAILAGLSKDERRELVRALVAIRPEFLAGRGEQALERVRARFAVPREGEV